MPPPTKQKILMMSQVSVFQLPPPPLHSKGIQVCAVLIEKKWFSNPHICKNTLAMRGENKKEISWEMVFLYYNQILTIS